MFGKQVHSIRKSDITGEEENWIDEIDVATDLPNSTYGLKGGTGRRAVAQAGSTQSQRQHSDRDTAEGV